MENNYNNTQNDTEEKDKSIDLSKSFDGVIEQRQQDAYIKSSVTDVKKAKKKKIYFAIIVVGWIIIISIAMSAWNSSQKKKEQTQKIKQEMQDRIKLNTNIPRG